MEDQAMKKILIIFTVCMMFSFTSKTQNNCGASELFLKMQNHAPFQLFVDNMQMPGYSNSFHIPNLLPGMHSVKIVRFIGNGYGNYQHQVVINREIFIPAMTSVYAVMKNNGQLKIYNTVAMMQIPNNNYFPPAPASCLGNTYINNHIIGMPDQVFMQLKQSLANTAFDNTKLSIAKQALAYNNISSNQVLALMNLMTFESTKLAFAKYAYQYVADPNNYFVVNNGFGFNSSVNDLNNFLAMY
jgi:hypothetical protein